MVIILINEIICLTMSSPQVNQIFGNLLIFIELTSYFYQLAYEVNNEPENSVVNVSMINLSLTLTIL